MRTLAQRLKIHVLICAAIRRTTSNLPISAKCRLNDVFSYPMQYTVFCIHCYSKSKLISRILKYNIERLKIEIYVIVHVAYFLHRTDQTMQAQRQP